MKMIRFPALLDIISSPLGICLEDMTTTLYIEVVYSHFNVFPIAQKLLKYAGQTIYKYLKIAVFCH